MTETIKLPDYYSPDGRNARYGSLEELKELLLYKRIVKWDKDFLLLEDGTTIIHFRIPKTFGYEGQRARIDLSYEDVIRILNEAK